MKKIASCSFGKDSLAAIIVSEENGVHIDEDEPRIAVFHPCFRTLGTVRGGDHVHFETPDGHNRRRGPNRRNCGVIA